MYNKMHETEISNRKRIYHQILMVFGTICGFISFVMSIIELAKAFTEKDETGTEIAPPTDNS